MSDSGRDSCGQCAVFREMSRVLEPMLGAEAQAQLPFLCRQVEHI